MANSVSELSVFEKAITLSAAVSDIIRRDLFRHDRRLREQLGASSESVASLIAEGFEMSTDRHFAQYWYRARGSTREIRTQLIIAWHRGHITREELDDLGKRYEEIAKMLSGLIGQLERADRKHRR